MKEQISTINNDFINDFSNIYLDPSKVNKYLNNYSEIIEKDIKDNFIELNLNKNFVIYANGGFGRKEMFPSSDVDISIIEIKKTENYEDLEKFISHLWDQGYKVGHSVRTIKDIKKISKEDVKEYTSYLTRRPLVTNNVIDKKISNTLLNLWDKKKFFNTKLQEQKERHSQFDSTAYNLEPNLKESPGTLRDFQTALWILQHCFDLNSINEVSKSFIFKDEIKNAIDAYNFIKSLRFATNITSKENRLNFETQLEISSLAKLRKNKTNKTVEEMMKRYYEMASVLSHFNNIVFEKFNEINSSSFKKCKGIYKHKNKIGINVADLSKRKELIFKIFIEIGKNKTINLIDTETKSLLKKNANLIDSQFRKNKTFANQFLKILRSKHNLSSILKTMKDLGILQKYIPEFGEVVGQMQFDLFHVYTVDEHTFKLVRNMRQMKLHEEKGFEIEHELINKIPKIEILYIAGLFHDLGKGKGGDHSKIGAKTSFNFAKRIGMSDTDANLISWLVKNHLIMSSISQKKDISDNETIKEFAKNIKQIEKLDYLYLLTVNDIRATNPALWNGWKHQLLKDLYKLTRLRINKEPMQVSSEIALDRKTNVIKSIEKEDHKILDNYFDLLNNNYFNKISTEALRWQARLIIDNNNKDMIIGCRKRFENLIEVFIKVKNTEGLFLKMARILEHSGLEVIDANIFTSKDNAFAANTFITKYSHHDRPFTKDELKELAQRIKRNFKDFSKILQIPKKPIKKVSFEKIIKISHSINKEKDRDMITIETADRPGLLVDIAKVFFKKDTSIFSSRINTLGDKVEDTFEIEGKNKAKISTTKINGIIKALREVV